MSAPAGWYPQPDGSQRYWSGTEWTDRTSPAPAGGVVPYGNAALVVPQVAPKSPGLALLASFFIPGLGQLINGEAIKGVLMFLGYVFSFALMFVLIGFLTAPAIWIWGMIDAYQGAQRWNLQRGILS